MNQPTSDEDQQWLDALAGKTGGDPRLNAHAQAVRQAMQRRRQEIEADAQRDRTAELLKLRERLQREGLMQPAATQTPSWWQRLISWLGLAPSAQGSASGSGVALTRAVPMAVVLAIAGVGLWFAMQGRTPQVDERLIYRGDPNVVTLLVEDPEQRAKVLEAEVKALPAKVTVQALKPNGWLLRIEDSEAAHDYLATKRIEAIAVKGWITVLVLPAKEATQ